MPRAHLLVPSLLLAFLVAAGSASASGQECVSAGPSTPLTPLTACAGETSGGPGCAEGYTSHWTGVRVRPPSGPDLAYAGGGDHCQAEHPGYRNAVNYVRAGAYAPLVAGASVEWREWNYEFGHQPGHDCRMRVYAAGFSSELPCVAGPPPNPGWGTLLP
ncbi:MAG TPA: hypothetical protein VFH78_03330 [Candidatus Thermoplasmatota archaeon]|nr:hypothetical protein [Candidatus Thermoplasmatota archaeon]